MELLYYPTIINRCSVFDQYSVNLLLVRVVVHSIIVIHSEVKDKFTFVMIKLGKFRFLIESHL